MAALRCLRGAAGREVEGVTESSTVLRFFTKGGVTAILPTDEEHEDQEVEERKTHYERSLSRRPIKRQLPLPANFTHLPRPSLHAAIASADHRVLVSNLQIDTRPHACCLWL